MNVTNNYQGTKIVEIFHLTKKITKKSKVTSDSQKGTAALFEDGS
jgi:hypothetical protein